MRLRLGSHAVSKCLCIVRCSGEACLFGGFSAGMFHAIKLTLRQMRLRSGTKGLRARLPPPSIPRYIVGVANMYPLNMLSYYPISFIVISLLYYIQLLTIAPRAFALPYTTYPLPKQHPIQNLSKVQEGGGKGRNKLGRKKHTQVSYS